MPTKTWRWGGEEVVGGSGGLGKRVGWVMGSLWLTEATGCSEEHHKITLVFNFFFFCHRASPCSPGWPGTPNPLASGSAPEGWGHRQGHRAQVPA
jgi:hypothetical protein